MKKIANSVSLRGATATALCLTFLIYLPQRVTSAEAARSATVEEKTESQYRAEAARFSNAVQAVAAIATMKLDTGDDLKKAIAILDRERLNLKLQRSKLITLGLSDSTFTGAVKKRAPDQSSAESLIKEIQADPKVVLKLDGATSLKTRIQRTSEEDAASLRRVAERLKEAAERIKKATQGRGARLAVDHEIPFARVGFTTEIPPVNAARPVILPQIETVLAIIIVGTVVAFLAGYITAKLQSVGVIDRLAECLERKDDDLRECLSEADRLPSGFPFFQKETAAALCYSGWLLGQAGCMAVA